MYCVSNLPLQVCVVLIKCQLYSNCAPDIFYFINYIQLSKDYKHQQFKIFSKFYLGLQIQATIFGWGLTSKGKFGSTVSPPSIDNPEGEGSKKLFKIFQVFYCLN